MSDADRTAYQDHPNEPGTHRVSMVERAMVCDLLDEVGPDAPTLAGEWRTHQLAAHLRVREGNALQQARTALPGKAAGAIEARVAEDDFPALVREIRTGPPRLSVYGTAKSDRLLNTLEFFVHHEDVRRAAPQWQPRTLPRWAEDQVWERIRSFAKLNMRKAPTGVVLARRDTADSGLAVKGSEAVVVRGLPTEITLFAYGRGDVADVELSGPVDAVASLRATTFSV